MDAQRGNEQDEYEAAATTYVERYFDAVQNLPNDLQRLLSQVRELDTLTCTELRDYEQRHQTYLRDLQAGNNSARRKSHIELRRSLLRERQYGDEKLQLASQLLDMIEAPSKQLDEDFQILETAQLDAELARNGAARDEHVADVTSGHVHHGDEKPNKRRKKQVRDRVEGEADTLVKESPGSKDKLKKKKVAKKVTAKVQVETAIVAPLAIDPNEPTYCLCGQVSFGDMIGCDNDDCPMEWFHFQCVGLTSKPKGKWYCPQCRRDQHRSDHAGKQDQKTAEKQKAPRTDR